jgi:hypothetical protein
MEKLIDGKLYDTEQAELITEVYPNGTRDLSNFRFLREQLYVTESGSYFIAGKGGAKTKYSQTAAGGGTTGGKDIRAVTEKQAFQWCQRHDAVETAREHFPQHIEPA